MEKNRRKIFLVGMMGSGKTTTGKLLSQKINSEFIDLDHQMEAHEQLSIDDIFKFHGEQYFREAETKLLRKLLGQNKNFVLACGGGTPCFYNNMKLMNEHGHTVYLNISSQEIADRLSADSKIRPVLQSHWSNNLQSTVDSLLAARQAFYNQSEFEIRCDKKSADQIVEEIIVQLKYTAGPFS